MCKIKSFASGAWRLYKYSLVGDWSEHKKRLDAFKKLKGSNNEEAKAIREQLSQEDKYDEQFSLLMELKQFTSDDIASVRRRKAVEVIFFGLFAIVTIGLLAYSIFASKGILAVMGSGIAIVLWILKWLEALWRFHQLDTRRLVPFKVWLSSVFNHKGD